MYQREEVCPPPPLKLQSQREHENPDNCLFFVFLIRDVHFHLRKIDLVDMVSIGHSPFPPLPPLNKNKNDASAFALTCLWKVFCRVLFYFNASNDRTDLWSALLSFSESLIISVSLTWYSDKIENWTLALPCSALAFSWGGILFCSTTHIQSLATTLNWFNKATYLLWTQKNNQQAQQWSVCIG